LLGQLVGFVHFAFRSQLGDPPLHAIDAFDPL
jgi:hypothetical protein